MDVGVYKLMEKRLISFVIPCYRSEHTIRTVVDEIISVVQAKKDFDYEIILVNDCSPDNVWNVIKTMSIENSKIKGVSLSRNFGQQSAILAGYAQTTGTYVFSLDDDGQAPIESIFELIAKLDEGYDVVYAKYSEVKQNLFRRFGSYIARKMSQFCIGIPKNIRITSFFVAKQFIIKEMLKYNHPYPFLSGLVFRATKNVACVTTNHRSRKEGKSGYTIKKLLSLWLSGFTAFSVKPLEISTFIGGIFSVIGFIYAIIIVIKKIMGTITTAGWASIVCLLLIIGGIQMILLGLIGEYIGRIYICINNAPQYVVKETVGFEK